MLPIFPEQTKKRLLADPDNSSEFLTLYIGVFDTNSSCSPLKGEVEIITPIIQAMKNREAKPPKIAPRTIDDPTSFLFQVQENTHPKQAIVTHPMGLVIRNSMKALIRLCLS